MSIENVREALRNAECLIDAQTKLATAADQRAMMLFGPVFSVIVTIVGANIYYLLSGNRSLFVYSTSVFEVILLFVSIVYVFKSAQPVSFWCIGAKPEFWIEEDRLNGDLIDHLFAQLCYYQDRINKNNVTMNSNARLLKRSFLVIVISPMISIGFGSILWSIKTSISVLQ